MTASDTKGATMNDEQTPLLDSEGRRHPVERAVTGPGAGRSSMRDVVQLAARQGGFMLLVAALVTGLTAVFVYVTPLTYEASGLVLIERGKNPTLRADPLQYEDQIADVINSEMGIVKSRTVAEAVIDRLGLLREPEKRSSNVLRRIKSLLDDLGLTTRLSRKEALTHELNSKLKTDQPPLSSLLMVSFSTENPALAANVARAVIDAYLERHREIFEDNSAGFFEARVRETELQLQGIREAMRRSTATSEIEELNLRRAAAEKSYMLYREGLDRARADNAANKSLVNVRLIDYPTVPERPKSSRMRRILLGLAAGVVVAIGLALLRDYFDHTVRTPDDIASRLKVAVLGSVRKVRRSRLD
jgi:uncharacterized protein involved in exopolysaccharide biosynthesis